MKALLGMTREGALRDAFLPLVSDLKVERVDRRVEHGITLSQRRGSLLADHLVGKALRRRSDLRFVTPQLDAVGAGKPLAEHRRDVRA